MKCRQLFLLWLFYFEIFCVQNTSQGAAIATNSNGGPQGQREVRTTAYTRSRHGTAKNANGSRLKAGDLNSAAADWYLWNTPNLCCGRLRAGTGWDQ